MKTKSNKKLVVLGLMITMFALYGLFPMPDKVEAVDSLINAKATISDSDFSVVATTTMIFTTATEISAGGVIDATFHADFTGIAVENVTCSNSGSAGVSGQIVTCSYAAGLSAATEVTITVSDVTNPADDGDRTIEVKTYNEVGKTTLLDRVTLMVYIIDDVLMTATVDPILEFSITGVLATDTKTVNGVSCELDTTSTSTPFGTLSITASTTICQELNVTTNADDGYVVTVEQDQEMTSDSGSNINSFNNSANGSGSTTAELWAVPNNELDAYHTYGHMGLTSDDADLNSLGSFNSFSPSDTDGATQYVGLNGTAAMTVMHHDGPSDGTTQNVGVAFVAYTAEIGSLQEAGDYESTLTYIATPTY